MGLDQFSERTPINATARADSTYVAGTISDIVPTPGGTFRIDTLQLSNTDTAAHTGGIWAYDGTNPHLLGTFTVPAGAGSNGVAPTDILNVILPTAFHYVILLPGWSLRYALDVAPAAGKFFYLAAAGGVF